MSSSPGLAAPTGPSGDGGLTGSETGDTGKAAFVDALRRLGRRDHSVTEMRRALRRKGFAGEQIEGAIERLCKAGYLDDANFAERFAISRMGSRGQGRNRVRADLRRRGIPASTAEPALERALRDVSETEALDTLASKYWRQRSRDEPARRMRKLWAFLVRRGYPAGLVSERLRALWPRWSDTVEDLEPAASPDEP